MEGTSGGDESRPLFRPAQDLDMERRVQGMFAPRSPPEFYPDTRGDIPSHFVFNHLDEDDPLPGGSINPLRLEMSSEGTGLGESTSNVPARVRLHYLSHSATGARNLLPHPPSAVATAEPIEADPATESESRSLRRSRVEAMMSDPNERRWLDMLMQRSRMTRQGGNGALGRIADVLAAGSRASGVENGDDQVQGAGANINGSLGARRIFLPLAPVTGHPNLNMEGYSRGSPLPPSRGLQQNLNVTSPYRRTAAPLVVAGEIGSPSETMPTNSENQRGRAPIIIGQARTLNRDISSSRTVSQSFGQDIDMDSDSRPMSSSAQDQERLDSMFGAGPSSSTKRRKTLTSGKEAPTDLQGWRLLSHTGLGTRPLTKEELPSYLRKARMPIQQIPTELNELDQAPRLLLEESGRDGRKGLTQVTFVGTGAGGDADAAAVRANAPIQPACGVWYMECNIISKGQEGFISIGLTRKWTNLARLVGWEPGSYGWHMDDGYIFESRGEGTHKGWPTGTTGDTIGCGIDFVKGQAFFTKNGKFVGYAFSNLGRDLYPAIGLRTPGEKIDVNFMGPFLFDIDTYVDDCQKAIVQEVADTPIHVRAEVRRWGDLATARTTEDIKPISTLEQWRKRQETTLKQEDEADGAKSAREGVDMARIASVDPSKLTLKRKVTDVDGALAGAVLQYLRHQGYSSAASAFTEGLQTRDDNQVISSNAIETPTKLAAGWTLADPPYSDQSRRLQAEERFSDRLNDVRRAYTAGRVKDCWAILQEHYPHQLRIDGYIWSFRLRMQWFAQLIVAREEDLDTLVIDLVNDRTERDITAGRITDYTLGLKSFPYFICGLDDMDPLPSSRAEWLVAVGKQMKKCNVEDHPGMVAKMKKAFACMAYDGPDEWPEELRVVADRSVWEEEAEQLLAEIRLSCGEKDKSYLEMAITQTAETLFDLGIKRGLASATFADSTGLIDPKLLH